MKGWRQQLSSIVGERVVYAEEDDDDFFDEPEIVDPKDVLDVECLEQHCQKEKAMYEDCIKRYEVMKTVENADCLLWFFDQRHCQDHCIRDKLFAILK
mmetsp:Transcript_742/g.1145  ORF Transcript_742/g.1145 Transcript_742/m.1145 type:complete len:98 (+) Transcript_742:50-343(+)